MNLSFLTLKFSSLLMKKNKETTWNTCIYSSIKEKHSHQLTTSTLSKNLKQNQRPNATPLQSGSLIVDIITFEKRKIREEKKEEERKGYLQERELGVNIERLGKKMQEIAELPLFCCSRTRERK